jgi:hypothetical protein
MREYFPYPPGGGGEIYPKKNYLEGRWRGFLATIPKPSPSPALHQQSNASSDRDAQGGGHLHGLAVNGGTQGPGLARLGHREEGEIFHLNNIVSTP